MQTIQISNCCGAPIVEETDLCADCLEHCEVVEPDEEDEDDNSDDAYDRASSNKGELI